MATDLIFVSLLPEPELVTRRKQGRIQKPLLEAMHRLSESRPEVYGVPKGCPPPTVLDTKTVLYDLCLELGVYPDSAGQTTVWFAFQLYAVARLQSNTKNDRAGRLLQGHAEPWREWFCNPARGLPPTFPWTYLLRELTQRCQRTLRRQRTSGALSHRPAQPLQVSLAHLYHNNIPVTRPYQGKRKIVCDVFTEGPRKRRRILCE